MLGVDQKIADLYLKATGSRELRDMVFTGDDFRVTAAAARKYNLVTKIEPVSDYVKPGHYMAAFFRPNKKRANAALASLVRTLGNSSAPFVSLRIKGEIGKASGIRAANVRKQLATSLHANTILAHFDSVGGSVADAFDMAAAIMEHPAQTKKAIINGQCLSAAVIPLLAFDLRVANQNAEIMIYRTEVVPTARADKRWTASELAEAASTAEMADAEILDFITSRTGFDRKFFAREMKTEKPMRLGDALKAGLIHEIAGKTG
ncbi:ATP-dependent Clp protease proteolytic subunit [Bradyrhizobium sp. 143]|nr:ATP-dependent Clp protease proteolytic subunit [Bradyrhizobium sp. 143]MCK1732078.1 ATP-dependent Clp protease proteolytic subunit [Bradyrhizobium sp. 142]